MTSCTEIIASGKKKFCGCHQRAYDNINRKTWPVVKLAGGKKKSAIDVDEGDYNDEQKAKGGCLLGYGSSSNIYQNSL